jgi:hypothetical protein
MGIAIHSTWPVADDPCAERLAVVLPDGKLSATGIRAVMPQRRPVPARDVNQEGCLVMRR